MMKVFMQREDFLKEIEKLEDNIRIFIEREKQSQIPIKNLRRWNDERRITIHKLENQLESYLKLQSEVHKDIEQVCLYDSSFPLNNVNMEKRAKLIERVFYKVCHEWIGVDNQEPLSK
jgi:hypothetical protein